MAETRFDRNVEEVRRFNRFYTRKIGVLQEGLLRSPFSLTEVRVLYELAHRHDPTATLLGGELGLDAGYLSRILRSFLKRGLMARRPTEADRRKNLLSLTRRGRRVFAPLDIRAQGEVRQMLRSLSPMEQSRLIEAMRTIAKLLSAPSQEPADRSPYLLRPPEPGDLGWVVHRHGVLYAQEYGYDEQFEALVASIVAKFIQHSDAKRERCWIAEKDGEIVGFVFVVKKSQRVAKLRLLLVEPTARGLGIGNSLVNECVRFARQVGYRKITLWTQSELLAARRIYKKAGFRLAHRQRHHSFGKDLVAEVWERKV